MSPQDLQLLWAQQTSNHTFIPRDKPPAEGRDRGPEAAMTPPDQVRRSALF